MAPVSSKQLIPSGRFVPNNNVAQIRPYRVPGQALTSSTCLPVVPSQRWEALRSNHILNHRSWCMSPLPLVITSPSSKVCLLLGFPIVSLQFRWCFSRHELLVELLKEYRKLDDTVTMRINRTTAQFRDRDRIGPSGKGSIQEQACSYLWQELVGTHGFLYCYLGVLRA